MDCIWVCDTLYFGGDDGGEGCVVVVVAVVVTDRKEDRAKCDALASGSDTFAERNIDIALVTASLIDLLLATVCHTCCCCGVVVDEDEDEEEDDDGFEEVHMRGGPMSEDNTNEGRLHFVIMK